MKPCQHTGGGAPQPQWKHGAVVISGVVLLRRRKHHPLVPGKLLVVMAWNIVGLPPRQNLLANELLRNGGKPPRCRCLRATVSRKGMPTTNSSQHWMTTCYWDRTIPSNRSRKKLWAQKGGISPYLIEEQWTIWNYKWQLQRFLNEFYRSHLSPDLPSRSLCSSYWLCRQ